MAPTDDAVSELPENAVSLLEDNGVYKIIKKEGFSDEMPTSGCKVTVDYTGKLLDGTVFDSSHKHGNKFNFNLGKGEVIKAWDMGVASMKRGEICELHCDSKYAYGERGSPPTIPPNATLIFEVELHSWEGEDLTEDGDKGVMKEIIKEGSEYSTPNSGAKVEIEVVGKCNGIVFDDRHVSYTVNEADEELLLIPAIDMAVKQMKQNEHCRITVASKYGFGSVGNDKFNVPPNAELKYEIKLLSFEKAMEAWEMSTEQKVEQSGIVKEKGTAYFKDKKYQKAIAQYKKILDYLEYVDNKEENKELLEKQKALKNAGYLNLALCYNKTKNYAEAIHMCQDALKEDGQCEKALYRMGEAYYEQKEYEEAKKCFIEAAKVNPSNKSARSMSKKCEEELKRLKNIEKTKYKGMFDKFSKQDEEAEIRKKVEQQKERAKAKAAKKVAKEEETGDGLASKAAASAVQNGAPIESC